ncbi:m7GpppX diphosphatase isoform X2 [Bradysia coprophila]|uniref:m7GpppX diphosphatase isoform X2 n=1 Tax=Bradysia coprophila TaxID=38358 RepID=UPI00187DC0DD|nr:m7GpppX diphosphatase isoform X2 [Bradysia coprophila]
MESKSNYDFANFRLNCILNNNTKNKTVCLVGHFVDLSETDRALIILEKTAFTEKDLQSSSENSSGIFSSKSILTEEFINDIYGNFQCSPCPDVNTIKTTIIYPATDKHIEKYSSQEIRLLLETAELYRTVTLPYLISHQFSLDWVFNILDHKKESERIAFEDPCPDTGFILLPDLKWDGKTSETLYLLALIHQRNVKSLRDLTGDHLPLLRNIRDKGCEAIEQKYGVKRSELRIYLHYQPSFYHLHVHFTYLKHEAPGIFCEKSHLLDTVINNIELMPDYYQRATLSFAVKITDNLYQQFNDIAPDKRLKTDEPCSPSSEGTI